MREYFNFYREIKRVKETKFNFKPSLISRFAITPKIEYEGYPAWDMAAWMEYDYFVDTWKKHIVEEGERLDIISHNEYGDVRFWWVIALFNSSEHLDPYELEIPGTVLKILYYEDVLEFINTFRLI